MNTLNKLIAPIGVLLALVVIGRVLNAWAGEDPTAKEGSIVSIKSDKLVLLEPTGTHSTVTLADSAQVIVHGKPAKLNDLKMGMQVRVTMNVDGAATLIVTLDKDTGGKGRGVDSSASYSLAWWRTISPSTM